MPNPIFVEETFQTLVEDIEAVESIRQRISMLRGFFYLLDGNYKKFESYIVELIHYWPLYSSPITYSGISPTEIANDLSLLREIAKVVETLAGLDKYSDITSRHREVLIIMNSWVGESDSALKLLGFRDNLLPVQFKAENEQSGHVTDSLFLKEIRKILTTDSKSYWEKKPALNTNRIVQDLDYILKDKAEQEVLVPVVESFESLDGGARCYGRLRRLRVTVNSENNQQDDQILRRFNTLGVEKPLWLEDINVSLAARKLLGHFSPGKEIKKFKGELLYEFSGATHRGRSSNAAIAALWFTGLQKKAELRERFQLKTDIAVTGDIDNDGRLIPVAVKSVKPKVSAAFYSWATILVVPISQDEMFRKELFELKEKHPGKEFTLISAERLDELFYDRRISTHVNPSKARYLAGQMWKKKFESIGLVTIFLLSLVIFRLVYGPLDKNPVLYEYSGEMLNILNQKGALVDGLDVGEATVDLVERSEIYQLVDFEDVTDNGFREIFWAKSYSNSSGSVFMKEAGKEKHEWKYEIGKNLKFPNKPYVFQNKYRPYKIDAGDFNNDGEFDLIVNYSHQTYFPGILSLINASTGEEISHFIHPGRINDFIVADIAGDEKLEVILSGINNAYNRAFLAVLDIEKIEGYGPATDEYLLEGYENAEMLVYLLFPKTLVAEAITQDSEYNRAPSLRYNDEYGVIEVTVNDFVNYTIESKEQTIEQGRLYVYLSSNLDVNGIGTSDDYDITAEYLFENGTIDRYPDNDYFKEYENEILYWEGNEFVKRDTE